MASMRIEIPDDLHSRFKTHCVISGVPMRKPLEDFMLAVAMGDPKSIAETRRILDQVDDSLPSGQAFRAYFPDYDPKHA